MQVIVSELIETLEKHNQAIEVKVTWEGIFESLDQKNIYLAQNGKLIIDADCNSYKSGIQSGRHTQP